MRNEEHFIPCCKSTGHAGPHKLCYIHQNDHSLSCTDSEKKEAKKRDHWRRDYRFALEPVKRCATCQFVKYTGTCQEQRTECTLLDIVIEDGMRSACPGWQREED